MLANIMILEKSRNKEDVVNNLIKILRNIPKGDAYEKLKRIIMYLYQDIDEEIKQQIIKIIEESESEENMLTARKIIRAEFRKERREGISEGILEGIRQTIERMIKMNFKDDIIKEATGVEKSEIEKIRKEMEENKR